MCVVLFAFITLPHFVNRVAWLLFLLGVSLCRGFCKGHLWVTKGAYIISRFACLLLDLVVCCVQVPINPVHSSPFRGKDPSQRSLHGRNIQVGRKQFGVWTVCLPARIVRWWILTVICFRIGEARVPGPGAWSVGLCNPAGLRHKSHLFPVDAADVWLICETHLTSSGVRGFKQGIRANHSMQCWFVPGHPVKQRSTVSDHGAWSGVGVLAKHPCQSLPHDWSPWAFESSRLLAFTTFCHNLWLNGVVLYGMPTGPTHPQAKARTNSLVSEGVRRVLCMDGPRVFGGDFNHDMEDLPALDLLHAHQFVEVQDLLFLQQGIAPKPTCKLKTRRDFLFISPELIPLFQGVTVHHDHWIDHSSLIVHLQGDATDLVRHPWPVPQPIPWSKLQDVDIGPPCSMDFENGCDQVYREFWHQVEQHAVDVAKKVGTTIKPKSLGRATRFQPLTVVGNMKPITQSRRGEVVPQFFGVSYLHKQWFRQLRRLQSYLRIARVSEMLTSHVEHRTSLWHSILFASGFKPTFAEWWDHRDFKVCTDPCVPVNPPTEELAKLLFDGLEQEVRALEAHLRVQHRGHKSHTNNQIMSSLYKAVKPDAPVTVDVLVSHQHAVIANLDTEDCAIELDRSVHWDPKVDLTIEGVPLDTNMVTDDKVYVNSLDNLAIGQTVVQNRSCGKLELIFEAFIEHWSKFWIRHSNVPNSQWNNILDFARTKIGFLPLQPLELSIPLLRATAKSKKAAAAVGLDGVRRQDFLALSANQLCGIQQVFQHAHATGQWPDQVVSGLVKSLAKVAQPTCVEQYRPITVFSFTYRLWSSAQSRYWLQQLEPLMDRMLCGNRSGYQAATLWRKVLEEVEWAYLQGVNLCGVIVDLTKAYNTLPRLPCLALALLVGIEPSVITAWAGALGQMTRRFGVQGSVSRPVGSDRGFPEGCGLSCMAMLLLDQIWHDWVRQTNQMAQPMSYVDNWEILCHDNHSLEAAWNATLTFADLLDLQVDRKKTCVWATTPECRQALRNGGFTLIQDGKDLGAHMVYSRQIRNSSQLQRFRSLLDFWPRLKRAVGTFACKLRVVRTAAWPRALHGVASSLIGRKHFHSLRCCLVRALDLQRPGVNSFVLCHLLGKIDPQFVALIETVRSWRQVGCKSHQLAMLQKGMSDQEAGHVSSLTSVLEQRLQVIGWKLDSDGILHRGDRFRTIDLSSHNWSELVWSIDRAWQFVVATQVRHRDSFQHFERADVEHTRAALNDFQPSEQGILRRILSGATITNQHACFWSESGTDVCIECGLKDSLKHRFWECVSTRDMRGQLDPAILEALSELPDLLTAHGWTLRSGLEEWWFQYLEGIDDAVPPLSVKPTGGFIDLFTDGSCFWPTEPSYRLASWAVCWAGQPSQMASPADSTLLGAGFLPGLQQTAFRAELTALKIALTWARD